MTIYINNIIAQDDLFIVLRLPTWHTALVNPAVASVASPTTFTHLGFVGSATPHFPKSSMPQTHVPLLVPVVAQTLESASVHCELSEHYRQKVFKFVYSLQ